MKFYDFQNVTKDSGDLYIYGALVDSKDDWYGSDTDVSLMDFKAQLDELKDVKTLNMYINSPGGSVFVASAMISMLKRMKDKGTTINAYVDGLSASAASFLMMVADNINLYKNSVVMIHKPMAIAMGNSNDFQSMIDTLDKIEDTVMVPMYLDKAVDGVDENIIKEKLSAESWLNATHMAELFNVTLLDESKNVKAMVSKDLFKNYKHTPENLVAEEETPIEPIDESKIDEPTVDETIAQKEKEATEATLAKAKMLLELEL